MGMGHCEGGGAKRQRDKIVVKTVRFKAFEHYSDSNELKKVYQAESLLNATRRRKQWKPYEEQFLLNGPGTLKERALALGRPYFGAKKKYFDLKAK